MKISPILIYKNNQLNKVYNNRTLRQNSLDNKFDSVVFTSNPTSNRIRDRLSSLKDAEGNSAIPSMRVSMLLRECTNNDRLTRLIDRLSDDVLKSIDWENFCYVVSEYDINPDEFMGNIAVLNSMSEQLLKKFVSLTQVLFTRDLHPAMFMQSLKDNKAATNENISKIVVKSEKTDEKEIKNTFKYYDNNHELFSKDTVLFDSDGEIKLKEKESIIQQEGSAIKSERQIDDYSTNKQYLVDSDISRVSKKTLIPQYELCVEKGEEGIKQITYRYHTPISGIYNVCEIIPGEEPTNIAFATQNDDEIHVRKKMKSYEGISTLYSLDLKRDGQKTLTYIISDTQGKVLMSKNCSVQKINENSYITNVNGRAYVTTYYPDNHSLDILDINEGNEYTYALDNFVDPANRGLINLIISMEAPELQRLLLNTSSIHECAWYQSHYDDFESFDIHTDRSIFDLHHELGHAIDFNNGNIGSISRQLSTDEEFRRILEEEKAIYNKNSTVTQRNFLKHLCTNKKTSNYESEAFAEAYALMNGLQEHDEISSRSDYFQQHFPRTIAKVYEIINRQAHKAPICFF